MSLYLCFSEPVPWGLWYHGAVVLKNGKVAVRYIGFFDPGIVHTRLWVAESDLCKYVALWWNVPNTTIITFPIFYICQWGVKCYGDINSSMSVMSKASYSPQIHYSCDSHISTVVEDIHQATPICDNHQHQQNFLHLGLSYVSYGDCTCV